MLSTETNGPRLLLVVSRTEEREYLWSEPYLGEDNFARAVGRCDTKGDTSHVSEMEGKRWCEVQGVKRVKALDDES